MVGKLHTVSVCMGFQSSTCRKTHLRIISSTTVSFISSPGRPTLKVFAAHKTGIDVYVGQRDGAQLLKVKVQNTPRGEPRQGWRVWVINVA